LWKLQISAREIYPPRIFINWQPQNFLNRDLPAHTLEPCMNERDPLTPATARSKFLERRMLTFGLRRKPLKMFCEHCGKFIPSDIEWICGYCNMENLRTKSYSFLHKCEQCKRSPKSFHCPHCNRISFFDETHDDRHPARSNHQPVSVPAIVETNEQIRAQKILEREERKAELEYKIVCARLDLDLETLEKKREMLKKKSPEQILKDDSTEHDSIFITVHKIAKENLQTYEKEFADDPELMEMARLSVQKWKLKYV
jgi:hypothetical protein